jgi:flagellar basal-body rod protein FlgC
MPEVSIMPSLRISATGLDAESRRMEVIANNVANAQTTHANPSLTYKRKEIVFAEKLAEAIGTEDSEKKLQGVQVAKIAENPRPPKMVYRPGHPDANADGFVAMPNISVVEEMVDMMNASRTYEANLAAMRTAKGMINQALEIIK